MKILYRLMGFMRASDQKPAAPPAYDGHTWDMARGCPDCGSEEFYAGPEGGLCTNIICANEECNSAFNVGPGRMAERISNTFWHPKGDPKHKEVPHE